MIEFGPETCHDPEAGLEREWLETNGIGGFASSTLAGVNTRRYHGLLTAALPPPLGRCLLLSKLEETLVANGAECELSANLYPGVIHPEGFRFLENFRLDPCATFTYRALDIEIEKRIYMIQGENTTVIEYRNLSGSPCALAIRPLIAFRDYHATTHANPALNPAADLQPGDASVRPYESLPRLHLFHDATRASATGDWYRNFEYPRERERGLDWTEDLFQPLLLEFDIPAGGKATIVATTEDHYPPTVAPPLCRPQSADPFLDTLTAAADQFLMGRTVIAGYHWFSDWGRDTLIALPGLTLATGRFDTARKILVSLSAAADGGMIPNTFPDSGHPAQYNTADASLWFFEAVRRFLDFTGDTVFVHERLYHAMKSVIDLHLRGTRYGIHCAADGLIEAGSPDTNLTWMDARVNGTPVTPRNGKPVEIQALWYNALLIAESVARSGGDTVFADQLAEIAGRTRASFNARFWNPALGCLYDVVGDDRLDSAIRPNQVIALSLGHTMVPPDRARSILAVARGELLTDFGLRSLAPSDPAYRGRHDGPPEQRDSAYHQGTVWPWLLGPYLRACAAFHIEPGFSPEPLKNHLRVAGLGTISEIFDGDGPHTPRGCIAQAWSVAEVLLCYTDRVFARIS